MTLGNKHMPLSKVILRLALYLSVYAICMLILYPYFVMLCTALKSRAEIFAVNGTVLPINYMWSNFVDIWQKAPMAKYMVNSILVAGGSTIIAMICGIPAAYALSRMKFKGQTAFLGFIIVSQMFAPVVLLIGIYKVISIIGLTDNILGVRAVRQLLARLRDGDDTCSAAHLEAVLELCASEDPSGEVHLPGMIAWREYGLLCLELPRQNTPLVFTRISDGTTRAGDWEIFSESCTYTGQEQGKLEFWLRAEELALRPRQTGDELKLPNRPGKSVKKWLVEEKIPRRYREELPVFTDGGRLCAVAGLGADERFLPALGEKARHLKLIPPGEKRDEKGMQLHADE